MIFGFCGGGGYILQFIGVLAKPWGCGRFSSPLRNSNDFGFYHSTGDTPSVSHSLDSSLREGAGDGVTTHPAAQKPQRCGRFSSPLRNSKDFGLYHSTGDTPSVSLRSTAPSEREPGGTGGGKSQKCRQNPRAFLRARGCSLSKNPSFQQAKTGAFL